MVEDLYLLQALHIIAHIFKHMLLIGSKVQWIWLQHICWTQGLLCFSGLFYVTFYVCFQSYVHLFNSVCFFAWNFTKRHNFCTWMPQLLFFTPLTQRRANTLPFPCSENFYKCKSERYRAPPFEHCYITDNEEYKSLPNFIYRTRIFAFSWRELSTVHHLTSVTKRKSSDKKNWNSSVITDLLSTTKLQYKTDSTNGSFENANHTSNKDKTI